MMWALILLVLLVWFVASLFWPWAFLIFPVLLLWLVVDCFLPPLFGIERVEYLEGLERHKAWHRQWQLQAEEERRQLSDRGEALDSNWKPPPLVGKAAADRAAGRILRDRGDPV